MTILAPLNAPNTDGIDPDFRRKIAGPPPDFAGPPSDIAGISPESPPDLDGRSPDHRRVRRKIAGPPPDLAGPRRKVAGTPPDFAGRSPENYRTTTTNHRTDCYIESGDDPVAVNSGLDRYGIAMARPSSNIVVKSVSGTTLTCSGAGMNR
ncbi:hypothetical protein WN944_023202 [Citrus x changshan-huyou]|uniref:Uncharacterized protein n=1 Tax=Citrus x changshan-huyou TaxID=2935761 RepID=A0AAP0R119_9ROSI